MNTLIFRTLVGLSSIGLIATQAFAKTEICVSNAHAQLEKADSLKRQGQFLLSSQQYSLTEDLACENHDKVKARIGYSQDLYHLGEKTTAENMLQPLSSMGASSEELHQAKILQAWYEPNFRASLPENDQFAFQNFEQARLDFEMNHQLKKPWVAGTLSAIIPGMGQVYNGNYQSAGLSFVLNALFLATAIELNQNGMRTSSIAAGLIFSVTYTGGILGSVESAQQLNHHYQEDGIDQLRREKIPGLEL